jgi:hypothetical protein
MITYISLLPKVKGKYGKTTIKKIYSLHLFFFFSFFQLKKVYSYIFEKSDFLYNLSLLKKYDRKKIYSIVSQSAR